MKGKTMNRIHSLDIITDLNKSLISLKEKYNNAGSFEKYLIEKEVQFVKKQVDSQKKQYKIFVKQGCDDFCQAVVDELF